MTDWIPGLLVATAVAGSWFGLVEPNLRETKMTVDARRDVLQEIEAMQRRLESTSDLEHGRRQAVMVQLAAEMQAIRTNWMRARISRTLRPEIEMLPSGPALNFVEVGESRQERDV